MPLIDGSGSSVDAAIDSGMLDAPILDVPACPASCDDKNDCTIDSCDPNTFQCVHTAVADGTACEDGQNCTIHDLCQGGLCYSGPYKNCTASDQCHEAGVCSPKTGECTNPNSANGKKCNDGTACTMGDQCSDGICSGSVRTCAGQNICNLATGSCENPQGLPVFPAAVAGFVINNAYGPISGNGLASSPDGDVFMAGTFIESTDLGSGSISTSDPLAASNTDVLLAKLDPITGRALWTQGFGGPGRQDVTSFAVDGAGQIGIAGPLQGGSLTVAGKLLYRLAKGDYYVLGASSTDGTGLWGRQLNLQGQDLRQLGLRAIAGDPDPLNARFVLCGTTGNAAIDLDPSLAWQGGTDIVLASLRGDTGETVWAQQIGGVNDEECSAVAIGGQSNIYLVGTYRFGSTVAIGGLPPLPMVDQTGTTAWMFVAALDSSGKGIWAKGLGQGDQAQIATAVMVMPRAGDGEDLVVAGAVTGTPSFAGLALDSDAFVAMLDGSSGDVRWVKSLGAAAGSARVTAFSANSAGNLVVAGNYEDIVYLGDTVLPKPSATAGAFVALMDATNQRDVLSAIGYGDPQYANQTVGVMNNRTGLGEEKDTTLFVASFTTQLQVGQPAGLLSSPTQPAMAAIKLAP
jgi:hypothetical protein